MRTCFGLIGLVTGLVVVESEAHADDIRGPVVTADGFVLIAIERSGGTDSFKSHLAEPKKELCIHQGLEDVSFQPSEACFQVRATSNRNGQSYVTETRRCPTKSGWHETLVSSELYESYEVVWSLHTENGSTQLQWELKAIIPDVAPIILNYHLGEQMKQSLKSLGSGG